jgi:hypothetical protein
MEFSRCLRDVLTTGGHAGLTSRRTNEVLPTKVGPQPSQLRRRADGRDPSVSLPSKE